jgi:hypothetical protein
MEMGLSFIVVSLLTSANCVLDQYVCVDVLAHANACPQSHWHKTLWRSEYARGSHHEEWLEPIETDKISPRSIIEKHTIVVMEDKLSCINQGLINNGDRDYTSTNKPAGHYFTVTALNN